MDAAGLTLLLAELADDCAVAQDAAKKADLRLQEQLTGSSEACGDELARFYNVAERLRDFPNLEPEDRRAGPQDAAVPLRDFSAPRSWETVPRAAAAEP